MRFNRFINILIRGLTLFSKFVLIFSLAKYLSPRDLGLYGLISAGVAYSIYLVGFDFYIYSTREIIRRPKSEWGGFLKNQILLVSMLYLFFSPLLLLFFIENILPWDFVFLFFILLLLEHLNQEIGRLLIAASEQISSSVVLFLRSGMWALILTPVMYFNESTRTLNYVFGVWAVGDLSALALGVYYVFNLNLSGWFISFDLKWILKGIKTCIPFLVATLAIRAIFTVDRYFVNAFSGLEVVGAYVLFMGICNASMSFLDAGLFSFVYPILVKNWHENNYVEFKKNMRKFFVQTVLIVVLISVFILMIIECLLDWLGKSLYIYQYSVFLWLLLSTFLYALSMVPHYGLYAQNRDKSIIFSHVVSFSVFIISVLVFSNHFPNVAVPIGLCFAFGIMLIWKVLAYLKST